VCGQLAYALTDAGEYDAAVALHERALKILEAHPEKALVELLSYAHTLVERKDLAGVESLLEDALELAETTHGENGLEVAEVLFRDGARAMYERAIGILDVAAPVSNQAGVAWTNLGELFSVTADSGAADALNRALEIWEAVHGPDHPHLSFPLSTLSHIHTLRGRSGHSGSAAGAPGRALRL